MNFNQDIKDFLLINRSVYLQGIGLLYLEAKPAFLDEPNQRIIAPGFQLKFNENSKSNYQLAGHLAKKYEINWNKAKELIKSHTVLLLNNILNFKEHDIEGLGKFIKKEDNGLVFLPSDELNFRSDLFTPAVKAQKVPKAPVFEQDLKITSDIKPELSNVEVGLSQMAVPQVHVTSDLSEFNQVSAQEEIQAEVFEIDDSTPSKAKEDNFVVPFLSFIAIAMLGFLIYYWANLHVISSNNDSATLGDTQIGSVQLVDSLNETEGEEGDTEESLIEGIDITDEVVEKQELEHPVNSKPSKSHIWNIGGIELIPIHPEPDVCVIVVGSFKNEVRLERMKKKITDAGYEFFLHSYGEFTRVGIPITCKQPSDVFSYLDLFQDKFDRDAWLLN